MNKRKDKEILWKEKYSNNKIKRKKYKIDNKKR